MSIFKKLFGRKSDNGETPEFKAFLDGSMEGLRLQTEAHQNAWHFGKSERWDFDQTTGELIFTFPEVIARASTDYRFVRQRGGLLDVGLGQPVHRGFSQAGFGKSPRVWRAARHPTAHYAKLAGRRGGWLAHGCTCESLV